MLAFESWSMFGVRLLRCLLYGVLNWAPKTIRLVKVSISTASQAELGQQARRRTRCPSRALTPQGAVVPRPHR